MSKLLEVTTHLISTAKSPLMWDNIQHIEQTKEKDS